MSYSNDSIENQDDSFLYFSDEDTDLLSLNWSSEDEEFTDELTDEFTDEFNDEFDRAQERFPSNEDIEIAIYVINQFKNDQNDHTRRILLQFLNNLYFFVENRFFY